MALLAELLIGWKLKFLEATGKSGSGFFKLLFFPYLYVLASALNPSKI